MQKIAITFAFACAVQGKRVKNEGAFNPATIGVHNPASRSAGVSMADVMETTSSLEGPVIYWGSEGPPVGKDESDIKGNDNFGSFVAALEKAGLDKELKGAGPFTVFAPSDAAIAAFTGEITPELLKYHIVPGKISSSDLSSADLKTLNGKALTYKRFARKDFVDDAMVGVKSAGASKGQNFPCDVDASNGIVHSLNSVLEP